MTLEQLRIFVAVAERQHLTQAAEALHLSASAASAAIKAVEERYDAVLFHRVGRRIELTETGIDLLPLAKATLAAAAGAEQSLREAAGLQHGQLRIEASQTISGYWIPRLLLRFHETYPGIELTLKAGNTESVSAAVLQGAADLGFIEGDIDEPALGEKLVAQDRLIVVVAPGHSWSDGHAVTDKEIVAQHWVLRETGSGTRSAFLNTLAGQGVDPSRLSVAMTFPSNEGVRLAVASSLLAGVMSERVADAYLASNRLVRANYSLPPRDFRMLWHKERYRSHASRALEAMIGS